MRARFGIGAVVSLLAISPCVAQQSWNSLEGVVGAFQFFGDAYTSLAPMPQAPQGVPGPPSIATPAPMLQSVQTYSDPFHAAPSVAPNVVGGGAMQNNAGPHYTPVTPEGIKNFAAGNIGSISPSPPVAQHSQPTQSYQPYFYPHGPTFSVPPPPPPPRRR